MRRAAACQTEVKQHTYIILLYIFPQAFVTLLGINECLFYSSSSKDPAESD